MKLSGPTLKRALTILHFPELRENLTGTLFLKICLKKLKQKAAGDPGTNFTAELNGAEC
jgi:hypothetical protein